MKQHIQAGTQGGLAVVLHAHLPFVRHPEHPRFLEESWLFQAVTDVYLPLLGLLKGWEQDKVPARLTLSISPTLAAMLSDRMLMSKTGDYIESRLELAEKELHRTAWMPEFHPLAQYYYEFYSAAKEDFNNYRGAFLESFASHQESGTVELITTAATHAVLPLLSPNSGSIEGQIRTALRAHRKWAGRSPKGFWLPECAYSPRLDETLRGEGIDWVIVDTHSIQQSHATSRGEFDHPVFTPSGLAVFTRDPQSSAQVWSRECGYPGDPNYRDFYRDVGFDLEQNYIEPYLPCPGHRGFTGLKYHRITGPSVEKGPYDPGIAQSMAATHASHFVASRLMHLRLTDRNGSATAAPILIAPFDAELFGHWWHEGPRFLDLVARQASSLKSRLKLLTPSDHLENSVIRRDSEAKRQPTTSSWGEGGYWEVWLNKRNAWMYPRMRQAEDRFAALLAKHRSPNSSVAEAFRRAAAQLLLAQSSDWAFMIRPASENQYASRRFLEHLNRFHSIADWIETPLSAVGPQFTEQEIFPLLDLDDWRPPQPRKMKHVKPAEK